VVNEYNFPPQATPFVGRTQEVFDINERLHNESCRLITILGPGGVGKTRLAVSVIRNCVSLFADGVWLIQLRAVTSKRLIAPAIAKAIGFSFRGKDATTSQLIDYLSNKEILLLLDNYEHLLKNDGLQILIGILEKAPRAKLLVTSREALNLREEWRYTIAGLSMFSTADAYQVHSSEAFQMFAACVRKTCPHLDLDNAKDCIIQICRLVEGMPLAIEMAATWLNSLPCHDIVIQIRKGLLDTRFQNLPERHRSMRTVFDHSWSLLSENERVVFRKLCIFRGGFTVEAATAITDASVSILTKLIDKSLVRLDQNDRYQIHELLRQYGEERLEELSIENSETRNRHARYFARWVYDLNQQWIKSLDHNSTLAISQEIDNIKIGLQWALQHGMANDVRKYIPMICRYFQIKGLLGDGEHLLRGCMYELQGQSSSIVRDRTLGCVLAHLAWLVHLQMRNREAIALLQEGLPLLGHSNSQTDLANALTFLGRARRVVGDFERASELLQQAQSIFKAQNSNQGLWMTFGILGEVSLDRQDYNSAKFYFKEILRLCNQLDSKLIRYPLSLIGWVYATQNVFPQAREYLSKAINANRDTLDAMPVCVTMAGVATYLLQQGHTEKAVELLTVVVQHPYGDQEIQNKLRPQLITLQNKMTIDQLERIEQKAASIFEAAQQSQSSIVPSTYLDKLANWINDSAPSPNQMLAEPLTKRELEVLRLIATGLTNHQVAEELVISVGTVKKHNSNIFGKLNVKTRMQAGVRARELSLIT